MCWLVIFFLRCISLSSLLLLQRPLHDGSVPPSGGDEAGVVRQKVNAGHHGAVPAHGVVQGLGKLLHIVN